MPSKGACGRSGKGEGKRLEACVGVIACESVCVLTCVCVMPVRRGGEGDRHVAERESVPLSLCEIPQVSSEAK